MVIGCSQLSDGTWRAEGYGCEATAATEEEAVEALMSKIDEQLGALSEKLGFDVHVQ